MVDRDLAIEKIKASFKAADVVGDGIIGVDDLKFVLRSLADFTDLELDTLFASRYSNGKLACDEFIDWVMSIDMNLDSKMQGSLESGLPEQLANLMGELAQLEADCWDGEGMPDQMAEKRAAVEKLRKQGVKPSSGVLVFRQIDIDGSGTVDRKELQRLLKSLPKEKPAPGVKFVPFDQMMAELDTDKNDTIDLKEWLVNLNKLEGLCAAIESVMDSETGRLRTYRSLPEQLAKLMGEVAVLEEACWDPLAQTDQLPEKRAAVQKLKDKGVKPSPGVLVFRQIDVDGSGTVDRKELERLLKAIPKVHDSAGSKLMTCEELLNKIDSNENDVIDEAEWLGNMQRLPGLGMAMESVMDPETGRIKTYRTYPEQMAKVMGQVAELEFRCWGGEDVSVELPAKRAEVQRFRDNGVKPNAGVLVFRQIDIDGNGAVDRKELQRLLKALPKKRPSPGSKFVEFDDMMAALDSDKDNIINEEEWLVNLQKLPGLRLAIESVLDFETGRVKTYRSLPEQLAKLMASLKKQEALGSDVEKIEETRKAVAQLRDKGVKPSPGQLVFSQIDVDASGTVDRAELQRLLGKLPKQKPAPGVEFVPFEELLRKLDSDSNGTIDEDEWLTNLARLPGLRMALDNDVDDETGLLRCCVG
jgi:Ca2+-binding EF-hand superfamily protein